MMIYIVSVGTPSEALSFIVFLFARSYKKNNVWTETGHSIYKASLFLEIYNTLRLMLLMLSL